MSRYVLFFKPLSVAKVVDMAIKVGPDQAKDLQLTQVPSFFAVLLLLMFSGFWNGNAMNVIPDLSSEPR
jgi:hypothetical protein